MYEPLDRTAAQVVLALEPGDSIRRVSQRVQRPYETVRQAVNRLEDTGYLTYEEGLSLVDSDVREASLSIIATSARISPPSIEEAYVIPQFAARPFAFTRIDGVYVWTQGGYQVGRDPDDYPLFIAIDEDDVSYWEAFFVEFAIPVAFERRSSESIDGALHVVLEPRTDLAVEWVEGYPVIPRAETIEYMEANRVHFQSALAMLDRMYDDLDLGVGNQGS